jgi:protein TonB
MTTNAILPVNRDGRSEFARWAVAATLVLAMHAGLIAGYTVLRPLQPRGTEDAPAVIIDLAPLTVAPTVQTEHLAPGPRAPEPESLSPPKSEVVEPPKSQTQPKLELAPLQPLITLPEPKPDIKPPINPKEKPVEQPKEPTPPQQTAPPEAERIAPKPAVTQAGHQGATYLQPSWVRQLLAHLNRYKQYPRAARSRREEGVVTLSFTMDRNGRVLARHIAKSSGSAALDAEALAMLQRAEPLPAFPASMGGETRSFNVPIRFSLR